jgi:hypothetical protein
VPYIRTGHQPNPLPHTFQYPAVPLQRFFSLALVFLPWVCVRLKMYNPIEDATSSTDAPPAEEEVNAIVRSIKQASSLELPGPPTSQRQHYRFPDWQDLDGAHDREEGSYYWDAKTMAPLNAASAVSIRSLHLCSLLSAERPMSLQSRQLAAKLWCQ